MAGAKTKTINLATARQRMKAINEEIRYISCFKDSYFNSGVIAFAPKKKADRKQIKHHDQDVVCQVLEGSGRLRLPRRRISLRPGMVCHIPKNTPHDFAAGKGRELVLFYSLIKTAR